MKKILSRTALTVAVATLALGAAPTLAQTSSLPVAAAEGGRLWFVELSGRPIADGSNASSVQAEKAAFRKAAAAAGVKYTERRAFDTLFNGFSVEVSPGERLKLASVRGVKTIYPVALIEAPAPEAPGGGSARDMATAITMTGAKFAQDTLGLSGAGIKVAVMDTGIDIDHPDFGGTGVPGTTPFPSARVAHGYDFVGDAFNADPTSPTYNPVPTPDNNPDDCQGHGTHVAGIVGANGAVIGVAPGVTFGAYRVFGCTGSTTADIMLAAMERALADGMHVLNMSIGAAFQWPQYPTAQASDRLVDKGMVVVASIGNSGTSGLYAAGAPGVGKKVIGTASFDNIAVTLNQFTVSPDATNIGYSTMTGSVAAPTSGTSPMARTGTKTSTTDACNVSPPAPGSLAGKVALIRRGGCSFAEKAGNAQAAGAIGAVIYNSSPGRFAGTIAGSGVTIPTVQVSDAEGVLINDRLAAGPVDMTWTATTGSFPNATGNLISSFSSYGLAADLTLKPNIGAPGGLIYSTYPLEAGAYATLSGTSMASPHVAGGVALMLQAKPGTPAAEMRSRMQNTADPKVWWGNPGLGFLDNVHRQGAGMLDIAGTVQATATVTPGELALGESQNGPVTRTLTIRNSGASAVTYDLGHSAALATGPNTFSPSFFAANAAVAFSAASVAVPAGGSAAVDVTVSAPADAALADRGLYGGYVTLSPQGGGEVLRVPYAGFKGDYQAIQVLTPTANGFPWLAKLSGGSYFNQPGGASYSMVGEDIPFFLMHFDHHARKMEMTVLEADTGKPVHPVFSKMDVSEYLPRNSTATGFFAFEWDGTRMHDNGKGTPDHRKVVPNGRYVIAVRVLKALGDEANPAHWENWTSPVITLARP